MKKLIVLCLILSVASMVSASVWNPAANGITPPAKGNWNTAANWTAGVPVGVAPGDTTATFNVTNAAECQLTDTRACAKFVMGDGGGAVQNNVLRIMNGGKLTVGPGNSWAALGYNRDGGIMIVEKGGLATINAHLWFGINAGGVGRLQLDGGTVIIRDAIDLGRTGVTVPPVVPTSGFVTLNSGTLQARYLGDDADSPTSRWNIKYGKFVLTGGENDDRDRMNSRIAKGTMVGFGGASPVIVELIGGNWTAYAVDPMKPSPAIDETVQVGDVTLSWKNVLDPNKPGDPLYIDVWFGTDPNKLEPARYKEVVSNGANTTSVTVNVPNPGTYYWQVDTHIYNMTTDKPVEGYVYSFKATNDLPPSAVVIDTPNTLTWAGQPVQLNATVTDDGVSPLAIKWSVPAAIAANVTFSPSDAVEDPIITGNSQLGPITVTVTVGDAMNPAAVSDTMILDVAASACQGARGGFPRLDLVYKADFNGDCIIDLTDLAVLVTSQWLAEYALTVPISIP